MEQLELELWVEERITARELMLGTGDTFLNELYYMASVYGESRCFAYQDPASLDTIIRCRV